MIKKIIALALGFSLSACSTLPKEVDLPIFSKPAPIQIEKEPPLPIFNLKTGDTAPEVYNALIGTYQLQQDYIDYMNQVITTLQN